MHKTQNTQLPKLKARSNHMNESPVGDDSSTTRRLSVDGEILKSPLRTTVEPTING